MNLDATPADIFVHVISVPAAGPWDQTRAAQMSAELAAPLPAGQSVQYLRRLDRWTPGRPARFAVGYMRAAEGTGERTRTLMVEGRLVRFVFQDPNTKRLHRRTWLANACLAAGAALSLVAVGWTWNQRHDAAIKSLDVRAHQANLTLRAQRLRAQEGRNLALMQPAGLLGRSGSKVAADLAWLDAVRDRRTSLTTVAWTDRTLVVSTTSSRAPAPGATRLAAEDGLGRGWRIDPPTVQVSGAKPSTVSRAPHRRPAP